MPPKREKRRDREGRRAAAASARADVERARELHRRHAWAEAFQAFSRADQAAPLEPDDLFLLAMSAGLLGKTDDLLRALERAHHAYLRSGDLQRAARMAFWLVSRLMSLGETGRASGWVSRAQRLLEQDGRDCVERGYLLVLDARRALVGDPAAASGLAQQATGFGDRFADADLAAFARNLQGQALLRQGRVKEGLALLDEAMVAVSAREVSPVLTGIIYCSVIQGCQRVFAFSRCKEWTDGLAAWCEEQPESTFAGVCLVHRSEILQLGGSWPEAIEEARRAAAQLSKNEDPAAMAEAFYQEAELHRLRGEFAEAEEQYRRASEAGRREPQPGLALLRLAQGRSDAAATQIRRVMGASAERLQRTQLLPAYIEILLAAGDVEEADRACRELEETAKSLDTEVLDAMAGQWRGAVALAKGDARGAAAALSRALETWQRIGAPYLAARVRVLSGLCCRALDDEDGAALQLDAARAAFQRLSAAPDVARLDSLARPKASQRPHGLTARELQVLRLVAAGKTNKAIAGELFVSEKTIDRHLSNIFDKIDVPSRAAATAFAYEHELVQALPRLRRG